MDLQGLSAKANARKAAQQRFTPRKCSWTHKPLPPSERGAVQINVALLNNEGYKTGKCQSFLFASKVRSNGQSDRALSKLAYKKGLIPVRM